MPSPSFEYIAPHRLLTPELINRPSLHDIAAIAITAGVPGEYHVDLSLTGQDERMDGTINAYDEINQVSSIAPVYDARAKNQLLLGVFSLEMRLRGVGKMEESWDKGDSLTRRAVLRAYSTVIGDLYEVQHPHPKEGVMVIDLQSEAVFEALKTVVPRTLDAWQR